MRLLALALLLGCSTSRSAEREDSFAQQGETRTEAGPVRVVETVEEYDGRQNDVSVGRGDSLGLGLALPGPGSVLPRPQAPGLLKRTVTVTERAPVVVSSRSQTEASGEAKEARSARFGFAPWQWAIGGLALLAGLYGLFRLKGKLGL